MKTPDGWSKKDGKLLLLVKCSDFKHALALLSSIGDIAEKHGHHPDFGIRNYNEVFVSTTTHEADSLTEKDYKLAQEVSDLISYQDEKLNIETNRRSLAR